MIKCKSKVALVSNAERSYLPTGFLRKYVDVFFLKRPINLFYKFVRFLHLKTKLKHKEIWISSDFRRGIEKYDVFILLNVNDYLRETLASIRKLKPQARIIYWHWNAINAHYPNKILQEYKCEEWSYDEGDCKTYNLSFNTQFFFKEHSLPKSDVIYDVVFVGLNKGRKPVLNEIEVKLRASGLKTYFCIVDTVYDKSFLDYWDNLKIIAQSKAILEIKPLESKGLTLRVMESLFFNKKLITNDREIKNQSFYKEENIFILEEEEFSQISYFLQKEYKATAPDIKDYYTFEQWLSRFFN